MIQQIIIMGKSQMHLFETRRYRLDSHKRIIAFAEGEGRNAVYLARAGHEVTTVDYSEKGLAKTQKLAQKHNVHVRTKQMNLLTDDVPQKEYDAAIMVFGHHSDQLVVLNKLKQAVKPGGMIMIEVYSKEQIHYRTGGPSDIDMLYEPTDILAWSRGLKVLHFFYGEQERVEGKGHTGLAHVIQFVLVL